MTISKEDREILIKYRTEQAHEAIEEAKFLIANDKLKLAVNRILFLGCPLFCLEKNVNQPINSLFSTLKRWKKLSTS